MNILALFTLAQSGINYAKFLGLYFIFDIYLQLRKIEYCNEDSRIAILDSQNLFPGVPRRLLYLTQISGLRNPALVAQKRKASAAVVG